MKRKTFQKRLMAKGVQRNEAAYLSSEICKTHFPRGTSYAIGTCILAHVMAPTQVRMETCAGYYINAYEDAHFYADNTIVLQADPKQYPDLVQCIARGMAVLDRW